MIHQWVRNLLVTSFVSATLIGCGGGGGGDDSSPNNNDDNNIPVITTFSSEINDDGNVKFLWNVTDSDSTSVNCTITPAEGLPAEDIGDCSVSSSFTYLYSASGTYVATIDVTDSDGGQAHKSLQIKLQIVDVSLPDPVITAGAEQMVVFYNRSDDDYQDWTLHLWNNESCNAYSDFAAEEGTEWTAGAQSSGIDPTYGAYWVLAINGDATCANFIVHKGDEKDIGGGDLQADLTGNRMIWTLSGFSDLFYVATVIPEGVKIENTAAHWLAENTLLLANAASQISKVRVYSSDVDDLGFNPETGIGGDNYIEFYPQNSGTHPAVSLNVPRYNELSAFIAETATTAHVKQMLTGKLLAITYASDDSLISATYIQTPLLLDSLYTQATNDADEQSLGIIYNDTDIIASLWSPTAKQVAINVFDNNKVLDTRYEMTLDSNSGLWSVTLPASVDRKFYQYELNIFHPQNNRFETIKSSDPYSVSLSTDGVYSQFVNLNDADLKPLDWDSHAIPVVANPEDTIVYEGHIRDFSIRDESTSIANRGKYLAFTEVDSEPVKHLQALADNGLTHFQFLPANDIASIGEDATVQININNTVAELCAKSATASVCGVEDDAATLLSVYQSYDPTTTDAQALAQELRGMDSFNWGYDPEHFNTPDGSYASNPDGVARIIEMRAMNKALHEMNLRVVLDVVYNHTSTSGLWDNSVLDKVVPGYYHRRDLITGNVENATCCQDTAPEHKMMQKLMVDSLVQWTSAYKFDGFRFDIMSNNSVESIIEARTAVQAIDPDNYFYGEGWTRADKGYVQADQGNMAGLQVGTFNDRPRDIIRSAALFKDSGSVNDQDIIRLGLAGTQAEYMLEDQSGNVKSGKNFFQSAYGKDPADIINYVSKHDNETLWDQLQYGLPTEMITSQRVRVQNMAATLPLLSQGIPFFQLGGDLIRSKSMDRNTYDAGDWFNYVDFTKTTNNWNVGLPLAQDNEAKWSQIAIINSNANTQVDAADIQFASDVFKEFLAIRTSSALFRLTTTADIRDRVGFHNTGTNQTQGLIVMSIDDGLGLTDLDAANDAFVVVINGTATEQVHTIATAEGFELISIQQNSADSLVASAHYTQNLGNGTFTVPAYTSAVFVKPQSGAQGNGLAADATLNAADIAPYGDTEIYLSGSINNWGIPSFTATDTFIYQGDGLYSLTRELAAGTHTFAITDITASTVDLGFDQVNFAANSISTSKDIDGNIVIVIEQMSTYQFTLDASNAIPELAIVGKVATIDCTLLADSSDAIPFDIAGTGELYIRGSHSGWGTEEQFRLHYKGNNIYQAVADFAGDFEFKLASDDDSWTTQLWVPQASSNDINSDNLEVGITYPIAYEGAGTSNNQTILPQGQYSFLLTLDAANPSKGFNVGDLIIQQCE